MKEIGGVLGVVGLVSVCGVEGGLRGLGMIGCSVVRVCFSVIGLCRFVGGEYRLLVGMLLV